MTAQINMVGVALALNTLACIVYQRSAEAGWWTAPDGTHNRDNPLTFSNKISLVHSELSEALEGDRKGTMDSHLPERPTTEVELADALIRILDLARAYELDIGGAVVDKLEYNRTRQDHSKAAREAAGGKKY